MLKRLFFAAAAALLCLLAASALGEEKLTLMVYMSGSDLESQAGAASADLAEMTAALARSEGIHVAVLTGGALRWQDESIPAAENVLWQATGQGLREIERGPGRNMGDAAVLEGFLTESVRLFPAERYALILWDHGGGPLNGVCFDERAGQDSLTLDELADALAASPFAQRKLMFIGFDACLMASAEVAESVAPFAEYMIASQEPEPASGWSYEFLSDLPGASDGLAAGKLIIDCFADSLRDTMTPVTLSCLKLEAMAALRQEIDALFGQLGTELDQALYPRLAACRINTKTLGASGPAAWDLVDLCDLAEMLAGEGLADTAPLQAALDALVAYSYTNERFVHGLSIYSPFDNKLKYTKLWSLRYDDLAFSEPYRQYVSSFARLWLGSSRVAWQDTAAAEVGADSRRKRLSLQLTDEEAADIAHARLLILEDWGDGEYRMLYTVDGLTPMAGQLSAVYRDEALYILNQEGEILGGPLMWRPLSAGAAGDKRKEGGIATFGLMEDDSWDILGVCLTWMPDGAGRYLPAECYTLSDGMDMYAVSARGIQPGDSVNLGGYLRRLPDKDAAYEQWQAGETLRFNPLRCEAGVDWHLEFLPLQSTVDRVAVFEITDLQANVHLSAPIPLENPSRIGVLDAPETAQGAGMELTLADAQLYVDANANLSLDFTLRNLRDTAVRAYLEGVALDDTAMPEVWGLSWCDLEPGQSRDLQLTLSAENFQMARVEQFKRLRICVGVKKNYQQIDSVWLDFDLPLHLGMIALPALDEGSILAQFEQDGLWMALQGLQLAAGGDLMGDLHMENRSGRNLRITGVSFLVNGVPLLGSLTQNSFSNLCVLPAGSRAWCRCRISASTYENGQKVSLLPLKSVSEVRQIGLILQSEFTASFDLP